MGDIYLEPMLTSLRYNRGHVSIIFAFLESITLAAGLFDKTSQDDKFIWFAVAPISTVFTNTFGSRRITIIGGILASFGFFLSRWWTNVYCYYVTIGLIAGITLKIYIFLLIVHFVQVSAVVLCIYQLSSLLDITLSANVRLL